MQGETETLREVRLTTKTKERRLQRETGTGERERDRGDKSTQRQRGHRRQTDRNVEGRERAGRKTQGPAEGALHVGRRRRDLQNAGGVAAGGVSRGLCGSVSGAWSEWACPRAGLAGWRLEPWEEVEADGRRFSRCQPTQIRLLPPGPRSEIRGKDTQAPSSFPIAGIELWPPSSSPSGAQDQVGEGTGPHLESIRSAGRARARPGCGRGEGSQGASPSTRAGSAGAEEGPGRVPSPAPPAAGFHQQIWAWAVPEEEAQLRARKGRVTTQSPPAPPPRDRGQRLAGEARRPPFLSADLSVFSP